MKVSEVIKALQFVLEKEGDITVLDSDGWAIAGVESDIAEDYFVDVSGWCLGDKERVAIIESHK